MKENSSGMNLSKSITNELSESKYQKFSKFSSMKHILNMGRGDSEDKI